jgi:hypothetical protein
MAWLIRILGDALSGPRSRPSGRAALRLAGIAASIAIAGCDMRPSHTEWRADCVHRETGSGLGVGPALGAGGKLSVAVVPTSVTICVKRDWVCHPGKDSAPCGLKPEKPIEGDF